MSEIRFDVEHDPIEEEGEQPVQVSIDAGPMMVTAWLSYEEAAQLSMALWDPIDEAAGMGLVDNDFTPQVPDDE